MKGLLRLLGSRSGGQPKIMVCSCVGIVVSWSSGARTRAQRRKCTIPTSDLANDYLDRVAASESQIVEVLDNNPGPFVELKRWVARDAADRGQVVGSRRRSES
jgi:hypothetical protein